MRGKGCRGASTIHGLIYRARESGEEIPSFDLWDEAPASKADLIIIDECSMVDAELGRDLLSFGVPVLVLAIRRSCRRSRAAASSPRPSPT
jgi:exodeoxyribonuclease-5